MSQSPLVPYNNTPPRQANENDEREVSLEPAGSPGENAPSARVGASPRREGAADSPGAPQRTYSTDDLERPQHTHTSPNRQSNSHSDDYSTSYERRPPPPQRREYESRDGFSLFVKNVHFSVHPRELREVFEKFGPVQDVYIPKDHHTRQPKGFAYVQMERFEDAQNAIAKLDRTTLAGQELSIQEAKGRRKSRDEMRAADKGGREGGRYGRPYHRDRYDADRYRDDRHRDYSPRRYGPPRDRPRDYTPPRGGRGYSPPPRAYSPPRGRRYSPGQYDDRGARRGYSPGAGRGYGGRRSPPPRDYPDAKRRRPNTPDRRTPPRDSPPPRR